MSPAAATMATLRSPCEQWKDDTFSGILSWSPLFPCGPHISNFLHILEEKIRSRQELAPFPLRLPFSRDRWNTAPTKASDSETPRRCDSGGETLGRLHFKSNERDMHHVLLNDVLGEVQNLTVQGESENKSTGTAPVSKEELGRATWTFLHTLAAHFPDKPTRQQQKDAKELMTIISRLYPCKECADHFNEILKSNPVQAGSGLELSQWMCKVHNIVNRSLQKPVFPCQRVDARWGALDCDNDACNLQGRFHI